MSVDLDDPWVRGELGRSFHGLRALRLLDRAADAANRTTRRHLRRAAQRAAAVALRGTPHDPARGGGAGQGRG